MRLYLLNHAHAVPREEVRDLSNRPLSDKGRYDPRTLAKFLSDNNEKVDRILHVDTSWTRENAQLLGQQLGGTKVEATAYPLQADDEITPFIEEVCSSTDNLLLAGPSNICLKSISQLWSGRQEPYVASFANGVCACLERSSDGTWALQWMSRPEHL